MAESSLYISFNRDDYDRVQPLINSLKENDVLCIASTPLKNDVAVLQEKSGQASAYLICLSQSYCHSDDSHSEFLVLLWNEKPVIPVLLDSLPWPPDGRLHMHADYFDRITPLLLDYSAKDIDANEIYCTICRVLGLGLPESEQNVTGDAGTVASLYKINDEKPSNTKRLEHNYAETESFDNHIEAETELVTDDKLRIISPVEATECAILTEDDEKVIEATIDAIDDSIIEDRSNQPLRIDTNIPVIRSINSNEVHKESTGMSYNSEGHSLHSSASPPKQVISTTSSTRQKPKESSKSKSKSCVLI